MKQKKISRILSAIMVVAMLLACSLPAMAAEDKGVSVVLDGQAVTFTDAAPRVENGRTMLPLRAVLEAMGGTVSYDIETSALTGTLDDATLVMTVGSTEATITKDGVTQTIAMDVAPFIDSTTNRTYVPVRFAAEAFGCNVGWDQDSQTVIIVDVENLIAETLSNYDFTILEKFSDYCNALNQQSLETTGNMTMSATLFGQSMLTLDSDFSGVNAGQTAAEAALSLSMDMTGLVNMLAQMQGSSTDALADTADLTKVDMTMDVRADMTTGTFYFLFDDTTNALLGLPSNTWISMTMDDIMGSASVYGDSGMDLNSLMTESCDLGDLLSIILSSVSLDGKADTGYQELSDTVNQVASLFSDSAFTKTETGYEATIPFEKDGVTASCKLVLTTNDTDAITGYSVTADAAIPSDFIAEMLGEDAVASLAMFGGLPENLAIQLTASQTPDGKEVMSLNIDLGTLANAALNMDAQSSPATATPQTTPPEGATVVPYSTLTTMFMGEA